MAGKSVFIGNLPISADSSSLKMFIREHISSTCTCRTCHAVTTKRCRMEYESEGEVVVEKTFEKRYAFVVFGTSEEASACVEEMHGKSFEGRSLCVYFAEDSHYEEMMKSLEEELRRTQ